MTVKVYTKPNCVQCEATKKHLDKLNIEYSTVDISRNPVALDNLINLGYKSAPVVVTDTESWSGYQPDKLDSIVSG